MMSDDLSPMLSQGAHDNAPMISGRGTKIIADARGAYLAGNAAALIERLDERQQQAFRLAVIAFAYAYAERAFRLLPDDAAAHAVARQTFGEMIRENGVENDARMRVCDADGRRVITLRFSVE